MESFCSLRKRRGKANNNNLLKRKEPYCPVAVATTPRAVCTDTNVGKFWHSSHFSPAQPDSNKAQACPLPHGPPELFCVGRLVFLPDTPCVLLWVDSSCFQGMRLCAGPQGGWNDAWRECLLRSLCVFVSYCLLIYLFVRRITWSVLETESTEKGHLRKHPVKSVKMFIFIYLSSSLWKLWLYHTTILTWISAYMHTKLILSR